MKYFALVTRGLEDVALQDMQKHFSTIEVISTGYKRIIFSYAGSPADLLSLKSVDDVFFFLDEFPLGKNRSFLPAVPEHLVHADYTDIKRAIAELRDVSTISFSVSVSNVGEKNYTPKEIKEKTVEAMKYAYQWEEKEDGTQTMNLRVFIEKEECLLGVRVGGAPLHRRHYKQETLPGSLKPPVAYGMLALASIAQGDVVLDPLCGVGTIALEAAAFTSNIIAGDLNADAIRIAEASDDTDADIAFCQWDARHMELAESSVDHIVTNVPFGKQIVIEELQIFFQELMEEFFRVLKSGGNMVLLTTHADMLTAEAERLGFSFVSLKEISLFGLNPVILVLAKN